jgi:hypothetical protein
MIKTQRSKHDHTTGTMVAASFLGRLRPLLLLWLLASSEVLSVYASVPKAASQQQASSSGASGGRGGGLFKSWGAKGKDSAAKQLEACLARDGGRGASDVCTSGSSSTKHASKALGVATVARGGHGGHGHSHHGHGGGTSDDPGLNTVKLLLTVCLTTLNVACWLLPMKVRGM